MARRIIERTQLTSKTTPVRVNAYDGIVTTVALTDAADTSFDFVINNEKVRKSAGNSASVQLTVEYNGSTGAPTARLISVVKGAFTVRVTNVGTAVLNAACKIHFKVTHE